MQVRAKRVDWLPESPGEFKVVNDEQGRPKRLTFACPCGCGALAGITLKPAAENGWEWNGDLETPTCSPSIL